MEIKKELLHHYLEAAAVEQLVSEYQGRGYSAEKEFTIDGYVIDLIVRKGDETIVFEIKAGDWSEEKRIETRRIRNLTVHQLGAKFKIVLVNMSEQTEIEIDGLYDLFNELLDDKFIDDFSRLATHHWIDEISDICITSINVKPKEMRISGYGVVTLGLQYGSDGDYKRGDGIRSTEAYQFDFDVLLDDNLELQEVYSLVLDTD